jgi:alpha-galactosidase
MSAWVSNEAPLEGPRAVIGVTPGGAADASAALGAALLAGRRPFPARTSFNSWFLYGTQIDDRLMWYAIDHASELGIELFQLDAGWHPSEGARSVWDFTSGLGTWRVDPDRFPEGLGPVGDYARRRGMRFGVWVEPERVSLATVGRPGLAEERFLATTNDEYSPGLSNRDAVDGQICLGDRAAREWVLSRLTAFIAEARPDYLKWDYNRWMICDRPDHGHPIDGGNFAHVRGLYEVLDTVRARFPALEIENCSGGGNRLDFGLARRTDAGWMDDTTAPSRHVRHNLEGLTAVFPASYLLSYVMPHRDEPIAGATDMAAPVRSRMMGTLGLSVDFSSLGRGDVERLGEQVDLARRLRDTQIDATTYLLTDQAAQQPAWEVVQQQSRASGAGLLWVFDNGGANTGHVRLRDLSRETQYELRSMDDRRTARATGGALMDEGLEVRRSPETAAQVFTLIPVTSPSGRVGGALPSPRFRVAGLPEPFLPD